MLHSEIGAASTAARSCSKLRATEYYDYDAANKLLNAGAKSYTYDDAGNTTSVTTGSNTTTLDWDGAGRMTGITYPSTSTNSFTYNGLGQRVGKTDSTGTLSYKLADDAIDSDVLADGQATYQYGLELISEVRSGNTRVYHADGLGTTRAMSNSSGAASASLETDAFGQTVSVGGTFTPFGFAGGHGYQSDPDSGLMKLGHRYYDPSTGRFLSRDPIHDGNNWYVYAGNDPANGVDPLGLLVLNVDLGGSSGIGIVRGDYGGGVALELPWAGSTSLGIAVYDTSAVATGGDLSLGGGIGLGAGTGSLDGYNGHSDTINVNLGAMGGGTYSSNDDYHGVQINPPVLNPALGGGVTSGESNTRMIRWRIDVVAMLDKWIKDGLNEIYPH